MDFLNGFGFTTGFSKHHAVGPTISFHLYIPFELGGLGGPVLVSWWSVVLAVIVAVYSWWPWWSWCSGLGGLGGLGGLCGGLGGVGGARWPWWSGLGVLVVGGLCDEGDTSATWVLKRKMKDEKGL